MIEVIPTILVEKFKEVKKRIETVEDYVNWVQLDIMDGVFVNNKTWPYTESGKNELKKLKELETKVKLEAHLMVYKPEEVIDDWLEVVDRVIIHFESRIANQNQGIRKMIDKAHKKNKQIGLALNPETDTTAAIPFLNHLDLVLIMTVQPGKGGQKFKEWTLGKIKHLREIWPNGNIEVDGGINSETVKRAVEAGANLICSGTYIFKNKNPKEAIEKLKI